MGGDGDATPLQSLLVAPEIAPGGCQQGDVPGSTRALLTALWVADGLVADKARTHLRDGCGFTVSPLLHSGFAVLVGHRDVERGDRGSVSAIWLEWFEGLEAGLAVFF